MDVLRRNIELKARCDHLSLAAARAAELGAHQVGEILQVDTYFRVPNGRLKLREIAGKSPELIWYEREDSIEFRASDYEVVPIAEAALTKSALARALGIRAEVRKRRELQQRELPGPPEPAKPPEPTRPAPGGPIEVRRSTPMPDLAVAP